MILFSTGFRQMGHSVIRSPHNWQAPCPQRKIMFFIRSKHTGHMTCSFISCSCCWSFLISASLFLLSLDKLFAMFLWLVLLLDTVDVDGFSLMLVVVREFCVIAFNCCVRRAGERRVVDNRGDLLSIGSRHSIHFFINFAQLWQAHTWLHGLNITVAGLSEHTAHSFNWYKGK